VEALGRDDGGGGDGEEDDGIAGPPYSQTTGAITTAFG